MTEAELRTKLDELRALPHETEWFEFKEANDNLKTDKIGEYFSALSNEANLKYKDFGWLVFGVRNSDRKIVGTTYREDSARLDSLKHQIAQNTNDGITFREIHVLMHPEGRVILFQIPKATDGVPTSWKRHYYGRDGESLTALNLHEIDEIRNKGKIYDWSAGICEGATIDDLDSEAIKKARELFKSRRDELKDEVDKWDIEEFLNKANLTIDNAITRTAIILLGKPESTHYLLPAIAKIKWILYEEKEIPTSSQHFNLPFIIEIEKIINKIQNPKIAIGVDKSGTLQEDSRYHNWILREALNNCIAHSDYEENREIFIFEYPRELVFTNPGSFMPESIENVLTSRAPTRQRNKFLADAMYNLKLIEVIGTGIKRMFRIQNDRCFPLPEYDLSKDNEVNLTVYGDTIDENYSKLLKDREDIDLETAIMLDKVQKGKEISEEEAKVLRGKKLITGRYPNISIIGGRAKKARISVDKIELKETIISFIHKNGSATRSQIDELLMKKLPEFTKSQKKNKIRNILFELSRKNEIIENIGSDRKSEWILADNFKNLLNELPVITEKEIYRLISELDKK